jgi:glycosyltransferase involved in cell wall biosynthesis
VDAVAAIGNGAVTLRSSAAARKDTGVPVNILHLRDTHEIGGPGKTILETHRAIDGSRFAMHLAVFLPHDAPAESPFIAAAHQIGLPVHVLRTGYSYDPRAVWQVARLVDELDIQILSAHEAKSDVIGLLAARLRRVATITTLHGWIGNGRKQQLVTALDKRVARGFDRAIAVSAQVERDLLAAGVRPERIRLLRNAIVTDRYRRTGSSGFLAELLGRPVPGPVIASVGRLSPEKGHADLLEAVALADRQGCRFSVVLVGDGTERPRLESLVRTLGMEGRVHMPGYLDRPERVLEEADLMVLPSHTEGLPNAALEALLMEVPVLATRVGGTPEVVVDGETGRLVEAREPAAMAARLAEFHADPEPWRRLARRGRVMAATEFDFGARTRKLESIYLELLEERRA